MKSKRWQDWLNLLLGAWLFTSPWVLQFSGEMRDAAWNAYLSGAAIMVFAAVAVYMPKAWEEAVNIILGAWVAVSPWVLGFVSNRDVMMNTVLVGCLVVLLAVWAMVRDERFQRWWQGRHHAA